MRILYCIFTVTLYIFIEKYYLPVLMQSIYYCFIHNEALLIKTNPIMRTFRIQSSHKHYFNSQYAARPNNTHSVTGIQTNGDRIYQQFYVDQPRLVQVVACTVACMHIWQCAQLDTAHQFMIPLAGCATSSNNYSGRLYT